MRQDQYERLQALHDELTDVFLDEADPKKWPGHGLDPVSMDAKTRGDRYWQKKNAVATIAMMMRVSSVVDLVQKAGAGTVPPEGEGEGTALLDAEVKSAEKEAEALLNRLSTGEGKAVFDRKVHGKR